LVQWQAAAEQPSHLAAMVVNVSPTDRLPYDQGVLDYMGLIRWLHGIRQQSLQPAFQNFWSVFESVTGVDHQ